ncbi:DUF2264 domain-containing protein [Paraflavitalea pollutisoli]|uniref:DUF2264 domain-containing protein n=1 Tax=Paraflavitalea pollutisoli TaxID=3034143 RepID=UPI0023ED2D76|nr:DUF2264 domain-containing protein [Paraflavitalea sp. H1-2-19X]
MLTKNYSMACLLAACLLLVTTRVAAQTTGAADRTLWLEQMDKLARPVMENLANGTLKTNMRVVLADKVDNKVHRTQASYLEAFGRTLTGISPWLQGEGGNAKEIALRNQYRQWAVKAVANAVNPASPDYLTWTGGQPFVDASFFALGLIRCPWLWAHLDDSTQQRTVAALRLSRSTVPVYSNWILFTGMVEAFFCKYGYEYDKVRIEFGIREFANHWYTGDGMFSDGMNFAMDYYNSYVIQPYLNTILAVLNSKGKAYEWFLPKLDKISKRYAELQEKVINTDGSFPATGRSIVYRGGAFHHLADMSYRLQLPASLQPAQVRGALTAVLKKTLQAPNTYNKEGWLNLGLYGHQPGLADFYINTGSLYLCSALFLPLGLSPEDPFWSSPAAPWSAVKIWSGQDAEADHALHLN